MRLGAGIHRFALGDLLEVAALPDLDEKRIGARLRFCLRCRRSLWRDDDLAERHGRRTLLELGPCSCSNAPVTSSSVTFDRLRRLSKLGECFLLEVLAPELLDSVLRYSSGVPRPAFLQLRLVLLVGLELRANLLDLAIGRCRSTSRP